MNQIVQAAAFEVQDAEVIVGVAGAIDAGALRSTEFDAVEYGSGWYHDAAISASEQAPVRER